ncbi:MAG: ECF transporter S component [Eubacterium sp.]
MKENSQLSKIIVFTALFAALTCVATLISIPLPGNGYGNLGDCFVILSAIFLGPIYGAIAAGIGAMLSDIFLGYAIYAPATLIIKALMAVAVGLLCKKTTRLKNNLLLIVYAFIAEIIMVLGYFIFEVLLYGFAVASIDIIGNGIQGLVGIICSFILFNILYRIKFVRDTFNIIT